MPETQSILDIANAAPVRRPARGVLDIAREAPSKIPYTPVSTSMVDAIMRKMVGGDGPLGKFGGTFPEPAASTSVGQEYRLPVGDVALQQREKEAKSNRGWVKTLGEILAGTAGTSLGVTPQDPVVQAAAPKPIVVPRTETGAAPDLSDVIVRMEEERQARETRRRLLETMRAAKYPIMDIPLAPDVATTPAGIVAVTPADMERMYAELVPLVSAAIPLGGGELAQRILPETPSLALRREGFEEPNAGRDALRALGEGVASILPFMLTKTPAQFAGLSAGTTAGEAGVRELYGEKQDAGRVALETLLSGLSGAAIAGVGKMLTVPQLKTPKVAAAEYGLKTLTQGEIAYADQVLRTAIDIADKEQIGYQDALERATKQVGGDPKMFWRTVGEFGLFNLPGLGRSVRRWLSEKPGVMDSWEEARRRYAQKGPAEARPTEETPRGELAPREAPPKPPPAEGPRIPVSPVAAADQAPEAIELRARKAVEQAGYAYGGLQAGVSGTKENVLFTDPVSGTTLAAPMIDATPERIQALVADRRTQDFPALRPLREAGATQDQINALRTREDADALLQKLKRPPAPVSSEAPITIVLRQPRKPPTEVGIATRFKPKFHDAESLGFPLLARMGRGSIDPDWVLDARSGKVKLAGEFEGIDPYFIRREGKPTQIVAGGIKKGSLDVLAADLADQGFQFESREDLLGRLDKELQSYYRTKRELERLKDLTPEEQAELLAQPTEELDRYVDTDRPDEATAIAAEEDRLARIEVEGEAALSTGDAEGIDRALAELDAFFSDVAVPATPEPPTTEPAPSAGGSTTQPFVLRPGRPREIQVQERLDTLKAELQPLLDAGQRDLFSERPDLQQQQQERRTAIEREIGELTAMLPEARAMDARIERETTAPQGELITRAEAQGQERLFTDEGKSTTTFSEVVKRGLTDWMDEVRGQEALDRMGESGVKPQDVGRKFWDETYFNLPGETQQRFRQMFEKQYGRSVDDVMKAEGSVSRYLDLGDDPQMLEGTERGFVVLMEEANKRFGKGRPASRAAALPKPEPHGETADSTPPEPPGQRASEAIADFGEKIGGARKDVATPVGKRQHAVQDDRPVWARKYVVLQEKDGRWSLNLEGSLRGMISRVSRTTFTSKEEAEKFIPIAEVSRNHRVDNVAKPGEPANYAIVRKLAEGRKRPVVKSGFETEEDGMRYMAEHPVEIIQHKFAFPQRPWLDRIERTGTQRRTRDVTTKMFQDTFGFRGGEFGNWNMGAEGQAALNFAYDALLDLADVLRVPPKALSLNGELAIAFGARGHGGLDAAAAHYEPDRAVINLTKIKGAGSLAHEWFHALDHYLGGMTRSKAFESVTATYRMPREMRKELQDAFKAVVEALRYRKEDVPVDRTRATQMVESARKSVQSRLNDIRSSFMGQYREHQKRYTPPKEAQVQEFDALAAKLLAGDLGAAVHVAGDDSRARSAMGRVLASLGRDSYENVEALNTLYKSVVGRAMLRKEGGIGMYLPGEVQNLKRQQERVGKAEEGATETRQHRTEFYHNARDIDMYRASDYWSLPHEMGARAFEAYVYDKLRSGEQRSDYLVYGTENRYYDGMKPYPEGAEREGIDAAFDRLFETIKTRETERGVALYEEPGTYRVDKEQAIDYLSPAVREHTTIAFGGYRAARRAIREVAAQLDLFASQGDVPTARRTAGQAGRSAADSTDIPVRSIPAGLRTIGRLDYHNVTLSNTPYERAQQLAQMAQVLRHPKLEHLHVVYLKENRILAAHAWTSGVINAVAVDPGAFAFETARRGHKLGAERVVILHNHPSGDSSPSRADVVFTEHVGKLLDSERTRRAVATAEGLPELPSAILLDSHVVIDHGTYTVIRKDEEVLSNLPVRIEKDLVYWDQPGRKVYSSTDAAALGTSLLANRSAVGMVFLNTRGQVVGYELHDRSYLDRPTLRQATQQAAQSHGAASVIIVGRFSRGELSHPPAPLLQDKGALWVLDLVDVDTGDSAVSAGFRTGSFTEEKETPRARSIYETRAPYQPKPQEPPRTWGDILKDVARGLADNARVMAQYIQSRRQQFGEHAFRIDQDVDRMIGRAKVEAAKEVAQQFLNGKTLRTMEKVFGERGAIAVARRLRELPFFGELFGLPRNRRELVRAVAEGVKGRDANGKLEFGAMERVSDPEMGSLMADVMRKTHQVDKLRAAITNGTIRSEAGKKAAKRELAILEKELEGLNTMAEELRERTRLEPRVIDGVNLTDEGKALYAQLTPIEKRVVDWFVDWRDEMKNRYAVEGSIEGYVRRFMLDPRHPFLPMLVRFRNNKFFNRVAGSRFFRVGGNYDYVKDLELVAYLTKVELEKERIHNGYVPMILEAMVEPVHEHPLDVAMDRAFRNKPDMTAEEAKRVRAKLKEDPEMQEKIAEHLAQNEGLKPGYQRINRTAVFGTVPWKFDGQIKDVLYDSFLRLIEEPEERNRTKYLEQILKTGADYWTANQLIAMQSIANQGISDAIFYAMKVTHDLPNPRKFLNDLRGLGDALRPAVLKVLGPEEFGSKALFTSQMGLQQHYQNPLNVVRGLVNVYFKAFNAFDLFVKRAGFMAEARNVLHEEIARRVANGMPRQQAKAELKDLVLQPEKVRGLSRTQALERRARYDNEDLDRDIDHVLDAYFPNYANFPVNLEETAGSAIAKLAMPFVRYRYEELRIAGKILRDGVLALNPKSSMPPDERIGRILAASLAFGGAILLAEKYASKLLDSEEEEARDIAAGRLALERGSATDVAVRGALQELGVQVAPDKTLMLRASKYPFVKFGMLFRSQADMTKVASSEFLSEGLALRLAAFAMGWEDEFNRYATGAARLGNEARSLVPAHRVFEDYNRITDPRMLRPETFMDAVKKAIPGVEQTGKVVTSKTTGRPLEGNPDLATVLATTGVNIAELPEEDIVIQKDLNAVERVKREKREELIQRYNTAPAEDRVAIRREAREAGIDNLRQAARREEREEEIGLNEPAVIRKLIRAKKEGDLELWNEAQTEARRLGISRKRRRDALKEMGYDYTAP